jgi:hypothetical protein
VSFDLRIPIGELHLAPAGNNAETQLELYLLSKDASGAMSPMRMVAVKVAIPSERMAAAAKQFYAATLPILLKKGPQTVAVGVVEPAAQRTSLLRTELQVGGADG